MDGSSRPTDQSSHSRQHRPSAGNGQPQSKLNLMFHIKLIAFLLILIIIAQLAFYYFVIDIAKQQKQASLAQMEQLANATRKENPIAALYNTSNLDSEEIRVAEINEKLKQFLQWTEYSKITSKVLEELKERERMLGKLDDEFGEIEKLRGAAEETTIEPLDGENTEFRFLFPKKLWVFDELKEGFFEKMNEVYLDNIRRTGQASGFALQLINHYNYPNFVPNTRHATAAPLLQTLNNLVADPFSNITEETYKRIERTVIMLLVLEANGGIAVSERLAFVENLDWLRTITQNVFANRGASGVLPRVFGFHNISRSSSRLQEKPRAKDGRFKFMVRYPGLHPYFLVAVRGSQFVHDLIDQIIELLRSPAEFIAGTDALRKNSKVEYLYSISPKKAYEQFFEIATVVTLLRRESEMEMRGTEGGLGLDHYGLVSMNGNYGPEKMNFFFQNSQGIKILQHLTKFEIGELEMEFGKVRYVHKLPSYYEMNDFVTNLTVNRQTVMRNSYFHLHFFPDSKEGFVVERVEVPLVHERALAWLELPRVIWTYWHAGLENSNIIYQLCADNMRRFGGQSGFKVVVVSQANLHEYLEEETIARIESAVHHQASFKKSKYVGFDLIRLALLARHGGIYMDLSYVLLENLDWLVNIARYPTNLIFNRYGHRPRAFMFFHPHYGSPFSFRVDADLNSKVAWHLGYENNFIAAEKGTELIRDWFEELLHALTIPYEELGKELMRCEVYEFRWTTLADTYLLPMDIVKYVIGRKQKELEAGKNASWRDASDYYGLWSMNGYLGQQKFRSQTSYDTNNHDNSFLRLYSEEDTELVLGKAYHLTKLYNHPVKYLLANFLSNYHHIADQFHPNSIFMKYLYNATRHSLLPANSTDRYQLVIRQ